MDPQLQRRIQQLHQMARAGAFGEVVRADAKAYDRVGHTPIGVFLAVVNDFYGGEARQSDQTIEQFTDLFCQLLIVVYREAKRADPTVAEALLHAFLRDYPGAPDTCAYPQLEALVNAGHAFKLGAVQPVWHEGERISGADGR